MVRGNQPLEDTSQDRTRLLNRVSGLEVEHLDAPEPEVGLPIPPERLNELRQRLILLSLGDVEIVDLDPSDHGPIVGHLESLPGNRIRLNARRAWESWRAAK